MSVQRPVIVPCLLCGVTPKGVTHLSYPGMPSIRVQCTPCQRWTGGFTWRRDTAIAQNAAIREWNAANDPAVLNA